MIYFKQFTSFINEKLNKHKYRIDINKIKINDFIINLPENDPLFAREIYFSNSKSKYYITRLGELFNQDLISFIAFIDERTGYYNINFDSIYEFYISNEIYKLKNITPSFLLAKMRDSKIPNTINKNIDIIDNTKGFYYRLSDGKDRIKISALKLIFNTFISDRGYINFKDNDTYFLENPKAGVFPQNIRKGTALEQKQKASEISAKVKKYKIEKNDIPAKYMIKLFQERFPELIDEDGWNIDVLYQNFLYDFKNPTVKIKDIYKKYKLSDLSIQPFLDNLDDEMNSFWNSKKGATSKTKSISDEEFMQRLKEIGITKYAKELNTSEMSIHRKKQKILNK